MSKTLLGAIALLGLVGYFVRSQAPEIERYRKLRKM